MALVVKKAGKTTVSAAELLKQFQKDLGDGIGSYGDRVVNVDRIPTGLFELDLALGGGAPRGKVTTIFGPESSNKTNIALLCVANHQKLWPDLSCVFVDVENEYNAEWAAKLGVDTAKLILLKPAYAEQAIDLIESMMLADDIGLIVLDSIAALVGTAELEKSAEGENPGAAARIAAKLYRKTIAAFVEAEKRGHFPTLIYINQITYKIGVMFGNPETMPGGKKPYYQSALILRVYGKNVIDKAVSQVMPVMKEVQFVVQKYKVPVFAASGKFQMATQAHSGLATGQCDDAKTIKEYLELFSEFGKAEKGGWTILGEHFQTQAAWKERLYADPGYGAKLRKHITSAVLAGGELLQESGE